MNLPHPLDENHLAPGSIANNTRHTGFTALFYQKIRLASGRRWHGYLIGAGGACWLGLALAQSASAPELAPASALAPFNQSGSLALHPAWHFVGLPNGKAKPPTHFEVVTLAGEAVLQISTDKSYGALVHTWQGAPPVQLAWQWRVEQPLAHADIATKAGDDAALKVCVLFDQPLSDIPLLQRASLAIARASTGQSLPSATLCYVWDKHYPAGTSGANPFTARVRYLVLDGLTTPLRQWSSQRRRVADDFQHLFGHESPVTPPVIGVAVGADSDNTQGQSLAYLRQLHWLPERHTPPLTPP